MPNQVTIGSDPVYKQGDALLIQYTVRDSVGAVVDLDALGVNGAGGEITFVLANAEGAAPILTKTLSGNPTEVVIPNPPGNDGRIDVTLTNAEMASFKGEKYHEIQVEPGPLTGAYGPFIITPASAPP